MRRGLGALFVVFLAARVFLGPAAPSSESSAFAARAGNSSSAAQGLKKPANTVNASAAPAGTASDASCATNCLPPPAKDLVETLYETLGAPTPPAGTTKSWGVSPDNAHNAHFLIATVPDPVHTHLSLLFDRQIAAIEEGVQQGGYLFSSAYLPWDNAQHAENSDFRTRLQEKDFVDSREDYPGVLVFHNVGSADDPPRLQPLVVFLVAETPTGGINKAQFANAIQAITDICSAPCAEPEPTGPNGELFIVGPTFSGSLYSLFGILKDLLGSKKASVITIHSGTTTGSDTIRWFLAKIAPDSPELSGGVVTFRTFQEGNHYALQRLLSFVCDQGYRAGQIAVLSEDETAFGNVSGNALLPSANTKPLPGGAPAAPAANSPHDDQCPNQTGPEFGKVLRMYFPRDVSHLRNAYQQDSKAAAAQSSTPAPNPTLQLNLADTGNDDDSVNIFSQGQTPLSQEAVMMGIVSNLQEHRVNLVVVEATNPLDTVFLVHYLRVADPDARVATMGSDLLLPRQINDPRLRGVIQITSYSLVPQIDDYTTAGACPQPMHLNRAFPSDQSVGTFNATLSLIKFQGSEIEPSCQSEPPAFPEPNGVGQIDDLIPAAYAQYGWPFLAGKVPTNDRALAPPLWLTILGRDQFWPVELLDQSDSTPGSVRSLLDSIGSRFYTQRSFEFVPGAWIVVLSLAAGFGMIYALLALNGTLMSPSIFLANFARVEDPWRNRMVFIFALLVCEIFILLFWPGVVHWGHATWGCPILLFVAAFILWDLKQRSGLPSLWALLLLIVISSSILALSLSLGSQPLNRFMRYRYLHVMSGVSPALPFLLLLGGGLWACWYSLSGRPPWDRTGTGPPLPKLSLLVANLDTERAVTNQRVAAITDLRNADLLKLMGNINWRIFLGTLVRGPQNIDWDAFILARIGVFTLIALAITLFAVFIPSAPHRIESLEGAGYDKVFTLAITLALALMLWDTVRLSFLWIELRRLLMALDRLPIRRGFARMVAFKSRRLWQLGGNTFEDFFAILSKEIQTMTALENGLPPGDEMSGAAGSVEQAVADLLGWMADPLRNGERAAGVFDARLVTRLSKLQQALADACANLLSVLNRVWESEKRPVWDAERIALGDGLDESDSKEGDGKGNSESPGVPLHVRLAEDFVSLFYVNFIACVLARMRALVLTISGLYVFALLAFSSYPFEPSSAFHTTMLFLLIFIGATVALVYGQAHKNATISRITNTKPGELGGEFWLRIAGFIAVPLLSLLAAKFPDLGGFLFSWLAPASQAFR